MNRIETKIVIMITNRLAAAKDSNAKTEMIEELSENLYQRYLELTAEGMPEEEALQDAMESLGDVEELIAFLKEEESEENSYREHREKEKSHKEGGSSFFSCDLESGIEEIVNAAFSTARVAVDCARDVAKDVSEQWKERYPDGVFTGFSAKRGRKVDCTAIPPEYVHSMEICLTNGNIDISCGDEEGAYIEITGDTEEIETMLKEDGVLSISQGNTASAYYFFIRGMRRSDIAVRLPKKVWDKIHISTVNGDIHMGDHLECRELHASTTSGNLDMSGLSADNMTLRSCSGGIVGRELTGGLHGETKSGGIEIDGAYGRCELFSASGDIVYRGEGEEVNGSSTSGDVMLYLMKLPKKARSNSISGDCEVRVAPEEGFHISYRTVSGKFMTNLPFTGTLGEKNGDAVYGDGAFGEIEMSSVSGDIELCKME
ncbi:MAG: DUF4097 family beta strand repeat-containing protein [Eubacteriales bacterium]|nr:DUF4097 family beta strand repeat-containing protein [Eubacteriales bacterium]